MHTPEQLALARSVCAKIAGTNVGYQYIDGSRDDYPGMQIALAAIIATQEADAKVAELWVNEITATPHENATYKSIAAAIRAGNQYGGE
jgi:hypothetical protein